MGSCLLFVTCDYRGGSSLRSWQLTHELSSIQSGVINIDDDLTYLYGQLPDRIRAAAVSVMAKKMRDVLYNTSRAILNLLGIGLTDLIPILNDLNDTDPATPALGTLIATLGDFFQMFSFVFGRLYGLNKNTTPTCGINDYEETWENFYDAANLRDTYNFMSGTNSYGVGRRGALEEIDPDNITKRINWNPVYDNDIPDYGSRSDSSSYSSGSSSSIGSGILLNLNVNNLPTIMELRVCEMAMNLRSSLSCLYDDTLTTSRILQECINNIEDVSNSRLEVTQKIIDIELELESLEGKEY